MMIGFKQAAMDDAGLLVEIYNASFFSDYQRFGSCPGYGKTIEMMEESIRLYPKHIILCDNKPVGCVSCRQSGPREYEIGCLCVIPEYQGKGIGTQAVRFVQDYYDDWKRLTLVTPLHKRENVRFYTEKCGFQLVGTERDGDVELARFLMERQPAQEEYMDHEKYMKRCYELAIQAGKKGFDTFGALLVHNGEILEEAENTADWNKGLFGHAEFNLVHKCANRYSDTVLKKSVLYTSCAPCERCLCAIASLGIENVVFGVSYEAFSQLTPHDAIHVDREGLLRKLGVRMKLTGPVLEDEGMHVFEWWGGEYRPLEELIAEMAEVRAKNSCTD